MKRLLLLFVLLAFAPAPFSAQEREQPKAAAHSLFDYLWLLEQRDKEQLAVEYQAMLRRLADSKVPDAAAARRLAIKAKVDATGGLLAEEGAAVTGLIRLGVNVPDFARQGDLVWVVRMSSLYYLGGTTQEMWISSTTGNVKCMLPFEQTK